MMAINFKLFNSFNFSLKTSLFKFKARKLKAYKVAMKRISHSLSASIIISFLAKSLITYPFNDRR